MRRKVIVPKAALPNGILFPEAHAGRMALYRALQRARLRKGLKSVRRGRKRETWA